jgi:hypothetical protein
MRAERLCLTGLGAAPPDWRLGPCALVVRSCTRNFAHVQGCLHMYMNTNMNESLVPFPSQLSNNAGSPCISFPPLDLLPPVPRASPAPPPVVPLRAFRERAPFGSRSGHMPVFRLIAALIALLFVEGALCLQLAAVPSLRPTTAIARRTATPTAQFGGNEKPRGISRDSEPEEFFKTNMGTCGH